VKPITLDAVSQHILDILNSKLNEEGELAVLTSGPEDGMNVITVQMRTDDGAYGYVNLTVELDAQESMALQREYNPEGDPDFIGWEGPDDRGHRSPIFRGDFGGALDNHSDGTDLLDAVLATAPADAITLTARDATLWLESALRDRQMIESQIVIAERLYPASTNYIAALKLALKLTASMDDMRKATRAANELRPPVGA
jgi:hypothetical protein